MTDEQRHATVDIDLINLHGQWGADVTCTCGETLRVAFYPSAFDARHAAEAEHRQHREFQAMHIGLFEELP